MIVEWVYLLGNIVTIAVSHFHEPLSALILKHISHMSLFTLLELMSRLLIGLHESFQFTFPHRRKSEFLSSPC